MTAATYRMMILSIEHTLTTGGAVDRFNLPQNPSECHYGFRLAVLARGFQQAGLLPRYGMIGSKRSPLVTAPDRLPRGVNANLSHCATGDSHPASNDTLKVTVWPLGWGSCSTSDTGRTRKIADQQVSTCATAKTFAALASADLRAR